MAPRLAAVAPVGDQRPVGPVYRSIIALDLEGSTKRTNPVKGELRRVMYELLECSLEAVAITGNRLEPLTDRGDGVLVLVRPHDEVPKTVFLDRMIPLLATLLAEYNEQAAQPSLRIRLRVVIHAGEIHLDRRGCYGEAIDIAIRLLDAPRVKKTLKQATAPLVLVVSHDIYSQVVCQGYVGVSTYLPLWARVGKQRHRGWVHVPVPVGPPAAGHQARGSWPAGAAGAAALTMADARAHYPAAG
jgi:class 3 adenylate cyclase